MTKRAPCTFCGKENTQFHNCFVSSKTSGFLEKTPEILIEEIMKEFNKTENYYDLEPANTEKFVYLPITIMNDILTELKEIKALLEKK